MKNAFTFFLLFVVYLNVPGQEVNEQTSKDENKKPTRKVIGTFNSNRILLNQSTRPIKQGELNFAVMHNFGALNTGFKEFFGLDGANTSLVFDYGISNNITAGIGRSTYQKNFLGYLKYLVLNQSDRFPLSIALYSSVQTTAIDWPDNLPDLNFNHRLSYNTQILLARKLTRKISFQLSPTYIHKNLVKLDADKNDIFLLSAAGRIKVTSGISIASEYSYVFPSQITSEYVNYFAMGVNIDTGGHIFQLRLSNATSLFENNYQTTSVSKWLEGDIHFGFTINRTFNLAN